MLKTDFGQYPRFHAPEEPSEGFVEPLERPPLKRDGKRGHLGKIAAACRQRLRLIDEGSRLAGRAVAANALLKGAVIENALRFADRRERRVLRLGRQETVFEGQKHPIILPQQGS